jgi:hypothetical protein
VVDDPDDDRSEPATTLTGVWQDAPAMGSGWANVYVFRDDGHYAFFPAGGCERVTERAGEYDVAGETLITTDRWQQRVVGGREMQDPSGCAIEGGAHQRVTLPEPIASTHTLGTCDAEALEQNDRLPCVTIDGVAYWRFAQDPMHFPELDPVAALKRNVLCPAELSEAECEEADYEPAGTLDLHGDGRLARVFTLTEGGRALCHVRAACFTVVERHPAAWRVVLRSMGSTAGAMRAGREGYRDLRVTAADAADAWTVSRYRWDPAASRYRSVERVSCSTLDVAADPALCRPVEDEVVLQ